MIFDMHNQGPDNPGQIRYQNEEGKWQNLPLATIYWAFESAKPLKHAQIFTEENQDYIMGDVRDVYIVDMYRNVYEFILADEQAEQLFENLHQANAHIVLYALRGTRLPLEMIQNCRDLGGMKTKDGRFILPHKLMRSDELHGANHHDKEILEKEYQLKTIIDLRTSKERHAHPDPLWLGVHHIVDAPFEMERVDEDLGQDKPDTLMNMVEAGPDLLLKLYGQMARDESSIAAWKKFFEILGKEHEGSILWHCTQGKDRTGIATMLLLSVLGVDWKDIVADYELTSQYLHAQAKEILFKLCEKTGKPEAELSNLYALYEARPEYLQAFVDEAGKMAGSLSGYIENVLEIDAAKKEHLQNMYLTHPAGAPICK
jgi:protein-tyrosine phosphatase